MARTVERAPRVAAPEPLALTLEEARGLALAAQRLDAPGEWAPPGSATTAGDVAGLIDALGVVQIDTISVVARS